MAALDEEEEDFSENENGADKDDSESSSDYGEEENKKQILSKQQKRIKNLKDLVRNCWKLLKKEQFIDLRDGLQQLNVGMVGDSWGENSKLPKFYVKHLSQLVDTIKNADPEKQENQSEKKALIGLKKYIRLENIIGTKQCELYKNKPQYWDDDKAGSDLGEEEGDFGEEEEEDGLFNIQSASDKEEREKKTKDDEEEDDDEDDDWVSSQEDEENEEDEFDDDEDNENDEEFDEDDDDDDEYDNEIENKDDNNINNTEQQSTVTTSGYPFPEELLKKMRNRDFWVKKKKIKPKKADKKKEKPKKIKKQDTKTEIIQKKDNESKDKWSVRKILLLFNNVLQNRGKSGVDRVDIIKKLNLLKEQCELHDSLQAKLTIMSLLVSFYFDTAMRKHSGMSGDRWIKTFKLLKEILVSLSENLNYRLSEYADIKLQLKDDEKKQIDEDAKNLEFQLALEGKNIQDIKLNKQDKDITNFEVSVIEQTKHKLDSDKIWIHGNLWSYIKKLKDQLWINLKSIQFKTVQYQRRLKHTSHMKKLLLKSFLYFDKLNDKLTQSDIYVTCISLNHNDYRPNLDNLKSLIESNPHKYERDYNDDNDYELFHLKQDQKIEEERESKEENVILIDKPGIMKTENLTKSSPLYTGNENILKLPECELVKFCKYIFKNGDKRMQTEAMLYLIYYLSLHNRFELSRDLLLMSHLGSSSRIGLTNVDLQILYNRTIAQFALCSFINCKWISAMIILQELFGSQQIKILLAQGYSADAGDNLSISKIRLLPHHLHINYDTLECAHLISSMFLEIPKMVVTGSIYKREIRNKHFRKLWDSYLRRDLRVPPENTQSIILTAGIYMQNGSWKKCIQKIKSLKLWSEINHSKYVYKNVYKKLKLECMRCYLYKYGSVYSSISFNKLSDMFNLNKTESKQFISKMIISGSKDSKFKASIDEINDCIIIHQQPPTPLQRIALEYGNKLSYFIEQNEKMLGISKSYAQSANVQTFNTGNENETETKKDKKNDMINKMRNRNRRFKKSRDTNDSTTQNVGTNSSVSRANPLNASSRRGWLRNPLPSNAK